MLPTSNSIDDDSGLKNVHKQIYGYKASSTLISREKFVKVQNIEIFLKMLQFLSFLRKIWLTEKPKDFDIGDQS